MKIYYWSPFLSKIATVSSVIKSIEAIKSYSNKNTDISIIDSVGEWEQIPEKTKGIKIIKLYKKSIINKLPKGGFLRSRFTQLFIFFISFFRLLKLLKKDQPDYLIAHLLVSLPLVITALIQSKTKLVIRISGLPRLNIFRKIYWKFFGKKVYKVTCPTIATLEKLKLLNIFDHKKLHLLHDPVISPKTIVFKKNDSIDSKYNNKKIIIAIGRLTKQKNFSLLLHCFALIKKRHPNYHLLILGSGEEENKLKQIIHNLEISNSVDLLGFKENPYKYLNKAECFILTSLWEDPGFVLLEAAYLNIPIIASNCPNGPEEILLNGLGGFLFENNNQNKLVEAFERFYQSSKIDLKIKKIKAKKYSKKFTKFDHYNNFKKIIEI
jgi:glycosyltransferase involved in cell wall biosynthesis